MRIIIALVPLAILLLSLSPFRFQNQEGFDESIKRGSILYQKHCILCHMQNGEGISGAFPPLAKSDYLMEDTQRAIKIVLYGKTGEVVVNGETFFGEMPPAKFTDQEIADVLNFVRNSWGNNGEEITEEEVISAKN